MNNLLTNSRLKSARACRRLHKLRYLMGYRPAVDALVLRFGHLVHLGLEAWWNAKRAALPQEAWLAMAMVSMEGETDPFELAKAQVMLAGYHLRWKDEPYEVLAVETEFDCQLRNPLTGRTSRTWRLGGKIDAVVRDLRTGLVYIVEHKTSAADISAGSEYWKMLRLDGQVSLYFVGAESLGHDVAGCLYDVLHKPAHQPAGVPVLDEQGNRVVLDAAGQRVRTQQGKWRQTGDSAQGYVLQTRPESPEEYRARVGAAVAEEPEKYFQRGEVVRLEAELREALFDAWQIGQQLHEEELADIAPRNVDMCIRFGRTCEFFPVCAGEASLDDPSRFIKSETVHPELSQQEAAP